MTININELLKELNKKSITKRVDKRTFINDLKAIETPYVEITFTENDNQILIVQPRSLKFINHIAKN